MSLRSKAWIVLWLSAMGAIIAWCMWYSDVLDQRYQQSIGSTGLGQAFAEVEAGQTALYQEIVLLKKQFDLQSAQIDQLQDAVADLQAASN